VILNPFQPVPPPRLFGLVGRQANFYFEPSYASSRKLPVDVECTLGSQYDEQCLLNFSSEACSVPLRLDVLDPDHLNSVEPLARAEILVEAAAMPATVTVPTVIIGDSIPASGVTGQYYLDQAAAANPTGFGITPVLLGTKGPGVNRHEAIGGWDIADFAEPTGSLVAQNSFVPSGGSKFNFDYWLNRTDIAAQLPGGQPPRIVRIGLGTNTVFSLKWDDQVADECDRQLDKLDRMIGLTPDPTYGSIRASLPNAGVIIALPSPASAGQDGFGILEKNGQNRARYKRNHVIYCSKVLERYKGKEFTHRVFIDGWNIVADPVNSFNYNTTTSNAIDSEQVKRANNTVHASDVEKLIGQAIWRMDNTLVARGWV
jgi:hypothetical protein